MLIGVDANSHIDFIKGKVLADGSADINDGDFDRYVGASFGNANGYKSDLNGRIIFTSTFVLSEISYKRYL